MRKGHDDPPGERHILGYLDENKSVQEISNKLKRSKDTIYNFLNESEGYGGKFVA